MNILYLKCSFVKHLFVSDFLLLSQWNLSVVFHSQKSSWFFADKNILSIKLNFYGNFCNARTQHFYAPRSNDQECMHEVSWIPHEIQQCLRIVIKKKPGSRYHCLLLTGVQKYITIKGLKNEVTFSSATEKMDSVINTVYC